MSQNLTKESSSSFPSTDGSQNSTKESSSLFPSTDGSQNSTEESSSLFPSTDGSQNSTEESPSSFTLTTETSENTSTESMSKKREILEAQDSILRNKTQEIKSPKTSTTSEHHKNMKKYYKKKENQIKLKLRLERYMVEMKLLEIKIKDLSTYLDICVCENKEDCKDNH